ncbi:DinB family protein [Paenibacillus lemnae]|uniref:DinB family protein n=1 Tax=Paenibacillus lemnae TaxID=1330551 RepID=A0A848M8V0_PAELE|nr:DinB family protein [Paenibacillus lemnae]NMO97648.1 DinB family protein [Paenibacillus lemnae]
MVKFQDIHPFMDQVRQKLLNVLASFGADEKDLREHAGGWSVTEVVEHLGKLEGMIQYQLQRLLAQEPVMASEPLDQKVTDVQDVLQTSGIGTKKINAPEPSVPSGRLSYEEAMDQLNQVRFQTKEVIDQLENRNTNDLKFPHPSGFELNANQWAHFIAIHETRHIQQLTRIREANR